MLHHRLTLEDVGVDLRGLEDFETESCVEIYA